ncbi:hypothetical protein [Halovenus halobia]|uniref:hypothetical protein n=1 Tax=Halovenus halobia TaxID=3396622 RepID=UPI003F563DAF
MGGDVGADTSGETKLNGVDLSTESQLRLSDEFDPCPGSIDAGPRDIEGVV